MSNKPRCTVEKTSRQVIESKLLAALSSSSTVAILATEQDLDLLIKALHLPGNTKEMKQMAADMMLLKESAFSKPEQN